MSHSADDSLASFSIAGDLIIFERPSFGHDRKELILTAKGAMGLAAHYEAEGRRHDAGILRRAAEAYNHG